MKALSKAVVAILALALLALPQVARAGGSDPPPVLFKVYPVVMNANTTSVDITWESTESATGQIKIGTSSSLSGASTLTDSRSLYVHKVRITGLKAWTRYYFQVILTNETSPTGSFVTRPSSTTQPFRLVALGDTRKGFGPEAWFMEAGEDDDHRAVAAAALSRAPNVYLGTGDYGFAGDNYDDVTNFFYQERALLRSTSFFPSYGNHDFTTTLEFAMPSSTNTGDTQFDSYFQVPAGGDFDYYSFNYSNVHFVAVQTNGCGSSGACPAEFAPGTAQYNFLASDLAAARANPAIKYIVAYHHQVAVGDGGVNGDMATLNSLYAQYNVNMVVQGHVHNYERATYNGRKYVVTGGGGSPLSGTNSSSYTNAIAWALNFIVVDFTSTSATVTAYGVVGDDNSSTWVLDTFTL